MLMRFWQVLVMAGLSMIAGSVLLGKELPVRTDNLQNAVTDLVLLAGYVNASTWAVAGALVAVVWGVRALAPGLRRLPYVTYHFAGIGLPSEPHESGEATLKQLLDEYPRFWAAHTPHVPWRGWKLLQSLVDLAPAMVGCLAPISPVREAVSWVGVVGIVMVVAHLWRYSKFPT